MILLVLLVSLDVHGLTIGLDGNRVVRGFSHTFEQLDVEVGTIRIIAARKAVGDEIVQYETGI